MSNNTPALAKRLGISRVELGELLHQVDHGDAEARAAARQKLADAKAAELAADHGE